MNSTALSNAAAVAPVECGKADLSIVIVNWNGGEMLLQCLASVQSEMADVNLDVIVVDNDSKDGSREAAQKQFSAFRIFNSGSNLGFGKANNLARKLVRSDLVLFLNPDTILLPHSLSRMIDFIRRHPDIGALGCKMRYSDGTVQEQGLQYFPTPVTTFLELAFLSTGTHRLLKRYLPAPDPNSSGYVSKLYGGCLLSRKSILDQVGWFDERFFMYAEDVDLCRSILDQGFRLYYLCDAEIIHVAGGTSKKAPSGFALLMKHESIEKMMRKRNGPLAPFLFRTAVFSGSLVRAFGLLCLSPAVMFRRSMTSSLQHAFSKCRTLLAWSIGLKKAAIPS